jgi:glycosyltransferase 2 family protein
MPESADAADATAPVQPRLWLRRLLTSLVAVAALAFVIWVVPFRDKCTDAGCVDGLLTTLGKANAPLLLGLFAVHMGGTLAWAARWRSLLGVAHVRLRLRDVWRVTLEAQTGGILLPGGLGGDALRIAYVRERAPDAGIPKVLASIVADRVIGLVTLATLAILAALLAGDARLGASVPLLAAIPFGALLMWWVARHPALARSRWLSRGPAARFVLPMLEYAAAKDGPGALLRGYLLSLVVSGVQLFVVRGLLASFGATPTHEGWVYVGTTFTMMIAALPAAPGAWGTADAAFVFFFGRAGITASIAAAVVLMLRVFWYTTALIGAISALARRPRT